VGGAGELRGPEVSVGSWRIEIDQLVRAANNGAVECTDCREVSIQGNDVLVVVTLISFGFVYPPWVFVNRDSGIFP
jgi:hypothetical protein